MPARPNEGGEKLACQNSLPGVGMLLAEKLACQCFEKLAHHANLV